MDEFVESCVAYASRVLRIDKVTVEYIDGDLLHEKTISAMYLPNENVILINRDWVSLASISEVVLTAFHETRHAYQKAIIDGCHYVCDLDFTPDVERWRCDFDSYHSPIDRDPSDQEYLNQAIEKDAQRFAVGLMNQLMKLS